MKVKRIICPACNSEKREVSERKNLHEYREEIISKLCEGCKDSPETRLLEVIFGKRGNTDEEVHTMPPI